MDQFRAPKWSPKWSQTASTVHRQIWTGVSKTLLFSRWLQDGSRWPREAQDSLLGAFLGLQRLSWTALDPQKHRKTNGFSRFLQMQVFGTLGLLMVLLGSSWLLLGRFGPKMTSKMSPQIAPDRP